MTKAYMFSTGTHVGKVSMDDSAKRIDLERTNPFLGLVGRHPEHILNLKAKVSSECKLDERECVTYQGLKGEILATSVSDALKKVTVLLRVSRLDFLDLQECRLMKGLGCLEVVRAYKWDEGKLMRENYVARKYVQIADNTKLYALFDNALRK